MAPVVLFFLVVAAGAPLLLVAKSLDSYSTAKPSTTWINNEYFFDSYTYCIRNIFSMDYFPQSGGPRYVTTEFFSVSCSLSPRATSSSLP